jgi:hypothetical protein
LNWKESRKMGTLVEIKPHRWGRKVFEAPGLEPVLTEKDQAINYGQNRTSLRSREIRIFHLFFRAPLANEEIAMSFAIAK